ncbi:DNA alkylation repair enzyme [Secundilactobacillus oryzae JCM 18671]|uniref:DNA alkylation repair enzyme n=1 Tax=Secundilactobacillus oryzae JCM 18671 TaxID=1291743 RepID=A0A081BJR4_9LACO|nr:DNA alkylation repair protein [Secundilactobacillus oryzae]GAK48282.1 DNA alkylation repair enzyme [Secundilactobacillus oryzae JCM 18671]
MTKLDFTFSNNATNKPGMEAYLKNQFQFLGLKTPVRKAESKALIQASTKAELSDIRAWIDDLYHRGFREYQYLAIDLAVRNVKRWQLADLDDFRVYIKEDSWWDSVDSWRPLYGKYIALHPDQKQAVFNLFFGSDNMWERRVAINLQLMEKENTDTEMLEKAILADLKTDEFFIQKAIGWSLRQYSKTNPEWVANFIKTHDLSKLAVREGSKYL